ncbi:MAG: ABC transporter permease subunit [Bryobacteraceae bacterium]
MTGQAHQVFVIARKEIIDHTRETRSLSASAMHLLMGPLIILLLSFSPAFASGAKSSFVVAGMMSIFVLVAAVVGGMNVSMDMMAGERERQSLLPLLANPISRLTVMVGKWIAASLFAVMGIAVTLAAFAGVCQLRDLPAPLFQPSALLCWAALGVVPLALLAAALQLAISTACHTAKEAQTYLSLLIFVPMGVAMFLLFMPTKLGPWATFIPIAGQQAIAESGLSSGHFSISQALALSLITLWLAVATIVVAAKMLERDRVVYGR